MPALAPFEDGDFFIHSFDDFDGGHFEGGHFEGNHFDGDDFDVHVEVDPEAAREIGERAAEAARRALDDVRFDVDEITRAQRKAMRDAGRDAEREMERAYEAMGRARVRLPLRATAADGVTALSPGVASFAMWPARASLAELGEGFGDVLWTVADAPSGVLRASASGESYTIVLPGLRLAKANGDIAAVLGGGSAEGLLVLEASDDWRALRAGDVLLAVDGVPVRDGDRASISFDRRRDASVQVVRGGRRVDLVVAKPD
jgi:hypothetical protein